MPLQSGEIASQRPETILGGMLSVMKGKEVFMDKSRKNEDTATRLRHVRAEKRETSKTMAVPGIRLDTD